jgi:hypothetical protein
MNALRLSPVIFSLLLLAAHFFRGAHYAAVALMLLLLLSLLIRRDWVPLLLQGVLVLGAIEWLRTLITLVHMRMEFGAPWARLVIILGAVTIFTLASALVFWLPALRQRYRREAPAPPRQ